jgi:hypothetical protein
VTLIDKSQDLSLASYLEGRVLKFVPERDTGSNDHTFASLLMVFPMQTSTGRMFSLYMLQIEMIKIFTSKLKMLIKISVV